MTALCLIRRELTAKPCALLASEHIDNIARFMVMSLNDM